MTMATGAVTGRAAAFLTTVVLAVCSCRGALGFVSPTVLGGREMTSGKRPGARNNFMASVLCHRQYSICINSVIIQQQYMCDTPWVVSRTDDLLGGADIGARGGVRDGRVPFRVYESNVTYMQA